MAGCLCHRDSDKLHGLPIDNQLIIRGVSMKSFRYSISSTADILHSLFSEMNLLIERKLSSDGVGETIAIQSK